MTALLAAAREAVERGRYVEAIERARELQRDADGDDVRGEAHRIAGLARLGLGQIVAALAELDLAVTLLADDVARARAMNDRGLARGYAGDHEGAIADHQAALALAGSAGDEVRAAILNHLGFAEWNLGRVDDADRHLDEALRLRRGRPGEELTQNNLGNVHRHRGDLDRAEASYQTARALARAAGNAPALAIVTHNLGLVAEARGDRGGAERAYREALALAAGIGDRIREADNLGSLGACLLGGGDAEGAAGFLRRATDLRRAIGDRAYLVTDLSHQAVAELGLGRPDAARGAIDEAMAAIDGGQEGIEHLQVVLWNAYRVRKALGEGGLGLLARAHAAATGRLALDEEIAAAWEREGRPGLPEPSAAVTSTFVGRREELAALRRALGRAARSEGSAWFVAGEPGIGKTRLVEELAATAEREGFSVGWGRGDEARDSYAIWHEATGQEVPEARGHDAAARFRVLDAFLAHLRQASAARPMVIALDDLHLADLPSLRLLAFLASEVAHLPVLIVGTYREIELRRTAERAQALGQAARQATTLTLRGLTEAETLALLGPQLPEALGGIVHRRSDGNPFFAAELGRDLRRQALLSWTPNVRLPAAVERVVDDRLHAVSAACREVLGVAAIAGRSFDLARIAPLTRWNEAGCLLAMEEAMEAGLVKPAWSFTSSMVRVAAYDDLPAARRAALHLEYAARATVPAEIARHLTLGGAPAAEIADQERRAAEAALARAAFEDARIHFDRAMLGEPSVATRCAILAALAKTHRALGDQAHAEATVARFQAETASVAEPESLARAVLAAPRSPALRGLAERTLDRLGDREPALRARLLARLDRAEESLAVARAVAEPLLLAETLLAACRALDTADDLPRRLACAAEAETLALALGDKGVAMRAAHARFLGLLELAELAGAEEELARSAAWADELHDPQGRWLAKFGGAILALHGGRWREADKSRTELARQAEHIGFGLAARGRLLLFTWRLRRAEGRLRDVDFRDADPRCPLWPLAQGRRPEVVESPRDAWETARIVACAELPEPILVPHRFAGRLAVTGRWPVCFGALPVVETRHATLEPDRDGWRARFRGNVVDLPDTKGMAVLARLLDEPGQAIHVLELDDQPIRRELERLRGDLAALEARVIELGASEGAERSRQRITKRIRDAIRRIGERDAALGAHLAETVRTGYLCSYAP